MFPTVRKNLCLSLSVSSTASLAEFVTAMSLLVLDGQTVHTTAKVETFKQMISYFCLSNIVKSNFSCQFMLCMLQQPRSKIQFELGSLSSFVEGWLKCALEIGGSKGDGGDLPGNLQLVINDYYLNSNTIFIQRSNDIS